MAEKLINMNLILVIGIAALVIYILYRMVEKKKKKILRIPVQGARILMNLLL
jgi:hypothetical protein